MQPEFAGGADELLLGQCGVAVDNGDACNEPDGSGSARCSKRMRSSRVSVAPWGDATMDQAVCFGWDHRDAEHEKAPVSVCTQAVSDRLRLQLTPFVLVEHEVNRR
jgi:hypothetical protein